MNREIKFRGKSVNTDEWIYGGYYFDGMFPFIVATENGRYVFYGVHPDTVGQYTGLKETCSGDIITFVPSDGSTKVKQKVTILYDENRACFMADSNAWYIPLHKCRQVKVIGTIHDKEQQ